MAGFYEFHKNGRVYIKSEALDKCGARHGFTTRLGGASHGKIEGMNFGFRVGDNEGDVYENYRLAAEDLGLCYENFVLARQTHTDNIRCVTRSDAGKGITRESDIFDTDGLITDEPGVPLVIFSADCVPILLAEPKRRVIAAVHSGWRGSVKKIARAAVRKMTGEYGADAGKIRAAIGASIGPCCFEVGEETAVLFPEKYVTPKQNGKSTVDLWRFNRDILTEAGVREENISVLGECTVCLSDRYYSYRAHREHTGRLAAMIQI